MTVIARDRAAEALCKASPPALDLPWEDIPDSEREPYYEAADAVLAAIDHRGAVNERRVLSRALTLALKGRYRDVSTAKDAYIEQAARELVRDPDEVA